MNEFELIAKLTRSLPTNENVVTGAGDDCAVLDFGLPDKLFLFKTDAVVEGIHFTMDTQPEKIGRKALARCLSDIAAMAGTPVAALVTLGLPAAPKRSEGGPGQFEPGFVAKIYDGLNALAEKSGVAIVGGETTTNPGRIFISIALLGTVPRGKQILRSGAKAGDAIFVPLFVLALALTWLYEFTDNLLAPIAAHSLFNTANLVGLHFLPQINEFLQKSPHLQLLK